MACLKLVLVFDDTQPASSLTHVKKPVAAVLISHTQPHLLFIFFVLRREEVLIMKLFGNCLCLLAIVSLVIGQFQSQFIGNFITEGEASTRHFCSSKECLVDAEILFLAATQNVTVRPCDDFKEFALGTFIKYRALNDRYQYRGLQSDVDDIYREKLRKVLSTKVKKDDTRVFKILKNYFGKCVNSSRC